MIFSHDRRHLCCLLLIILVFFGWRSKVEGSEFFSSPWRAIQGFISPMLSSATEEVKLGEVLTFEQNLIREYTEGVLALNRGKAKKTSQKASSPSPNVIKIKFPEASALPDVVIQQVASLMETWMDFKGTSKLLEGHLVVSKHILSFRQVGRRSSITHFIYRPTFLAELDTELVLPHKSYHSEALSTIDAVLEVIRANPQDQIIFSGLQGGGAIAMIHAWLAISRVPELFRNLNDFHGELHQVKLILLDCDCFLSNTNFESYPIPVWDVLRFYSDSSLASPETCRFQGLRHRGLAYTPKPLNIAQKFMGFITPATGSDQPLTRANFVEYFDGQLGGVDVNGGASGGDEGENEEDFDDFDENGGAMLSNETIPDDASEISMSVTGERSRFNQQHQMPHFTSRPVQKSRRNLRAHSNPAGIDELIAKGVSFLNQSVTSSKFFISQIKGLFRAHRTEFIRRNVSTCAAKMQTNFRQSLLGVDEISPVIKDGIKDIACSIESYNEKTKVAVMICSIHGHESSNPASFKFTTGLQDNYTTLWNTLGISVVEDDWEEVSLNEGIQKLSMASDPMSEVVRGRTNSLSGMSEVGKGRTSSAGSMHDVGRGRIGSSGSTRSMAYLDSVSVAGDERSAGHSIEPLWSQCLNDLFASSEHLNFLNPSKDHFSLVSDESVAPMNPLHRSASKRLGYTQLGIELPFSNGNQATCSYDIVSDVNDFHRTYRYFPYIFFSIFSKSIKNADIPKSCEGILKPIRIAPEKLGNAKDHLNNLQGFFSSPRRVSLKDNDVNEYKVIETVTNLPSKNPYDALTSSMYNLMSECLSSSPLERLYDCTSQLTLWAGKDLCPVACHESFPRKDHFHLCSRILKCGDGIHFGFRGDGFLPDKNNGKLADQFEAIQHVTDSQNGNRPCYYAAFNIRKSHSKGCRFSFFMTSSSLHDASSAGGTRHSHCGHSVKEKEDFDEDEFSDDGREFDSSENLKSGDIPPSSQQHVSKQRNSQESVDYEEADVLEFDLQPSSQLIVGKEEDSKKKSAGVVPSEVTELVVEEGGEEFDADSTLIQNQSLSLIDGEISSQPPPSSQQQMAKQRNSQKLIEREETDVIELAVQPSSQLTVDHEEDSKKGSTGVVLSEVVAELIVEEEEEIDADSTLVQDHDLSLIGGEVSSQLLPSSLVSQNESGNDFTVGAQNLQPTTNSSGNKKKSRKKK